MTFFKWMSWKFGYIQEEVTVSSKFGAFKFGAAKFGE